MSERAAVIAGASVAIAGGIIGLWVESYFPMLAFTGMSVAFFCGYLWR